MLGLLLGTLAVGPWCVGVAVGLGFRLALRFAPRAGPATQVALAFLLGTALLAYTVLVLGLVGALQPLPVLGLLVGLSIPAVRDARRIGARLFAMGGDLAAAYRAGRPQDRALILLVGLLTGLSLVVPLLPVSSADALAYATAVPERFARDGRIQFYPDSYESAFILVTETLHTIGYVLGLRPIGVWFEVAAQLLLGFAAADCYRASRNDPRVGSSYHFGVALLVMPLVQLMPFMVKAHLVELLAIVVSLTLALEAPANGGWQGLGACVGVALATKYITAPGILPLLTPIAVIETWRQRAAPPVTALVAAAGWGLLFASPFYVRNFLWTGDPLFPGSVLGLVSPYHLRHHAAWIASVYNEASGYGRGVADLLLWWLRASVLPIRGSGSYIGTFSLTFLPLALLARPRAPRLAAVALGCGAATVALFVLSGQFERYFLAPLAAMTLLAVAGWDAQREARRAVHGTGYALLLAVGLLATLPLKAYGLIVHVPALASRAAEERVLDRTTPWYADLRKVRTLVPADQPILCLLRNCQYLVNHRREDVLFRLVEAGQDRGGIDPGRVRQGLRAEGIRYVVAREPTGEGPDADLLAWLARAGGRVVYRNPAARFGTRDPRHVDTAVVILIDLGDG